MREKCKAECEEEKKKAEVRGQSSESICTCNEYHKMLILFSYYCYTLTPSLMKENRMDIKKKKKKCTLRVLSNVRWYSWWRKNKHIYIHTSRIKLERVSLHIAETGNHRGMSRRSTCETVRELAFARHQGSSKRCISPWFLLLFLQFLTIAHPCNNHL